MSHNFGLNEAMVHPREVFKASILSNANSVICFHNHPSGDITPSQQDIEVTNRLMECGKYWPGSRNPGMHTASP